MATTPRIYEKSNSFVEIRHTHPHHESVRGRIEQLARRMELDPSTDYRHEILREASRELLEDPERSRFALHDFVVDEISRLEDESELERYLFYRFRYEIFP